MVKLLNNSNKTIIIIIKIIVPSCVFLSLEFPSCDGGQKFAWRNVSKNFKKKFSLVKILKKEWILHLFNIL